MARFQIRRRADQGGSYRWQHVIRTPEGLAFGSIYTKLGDDLTTDEALELRRHCARAKYQVRRAP
jgi:hypothetical protein